MNKSKTNTQDAIMIAKKNRVNINTKTIYHYKNIISKCKKDIANGIDVKVNEATIIELEESINLLELSNNKTSQSLIEIKKI